MSTATLADVEKKRGKIDEERENISPRLSGLQHKLDGLQGALSEYLIKQSLGERVEKHLERVRAEIAETDRELAEVHLLAAGLDKAKERAQAEELAVKLGLAEARGRQLVPELETLKAEWFELRERARQISAALNEKQRTLNGCLDTSVTLRQALQLEGAELPSYKPVLWRMVGHHISPDQLEGKKTWG